MVMNRSERVIEAKLIREGFVVVSVGVEGLTASVYVRRPTQMKYVRAQTTYGPDGTDDSVLVELLRQIRVQLGEFQQAALQLG